MERAVGAGMFGMMNTCADNDDDKESLTNSSCSVEGPAARVTTPAEPAAGAYKLCGKLPNRLLWADSGFGLGLNVQCGHLAQNSDLTASRISSCPVLSQLDCRIPLPQPESQPTVQRTIIGT
jgi:hypothetical protein